MPDATYIGKNGNFAEAKIWQPWMEAAASVARKLMEFNEVDNEDGESVQYDPFGYNEAASVSLLVAAAERIGMVSLAEYVTRKSHKDKRRKDRNGRTDLWLCDANDKHWEFEFKQPYDKMYGLAALEKMMTSSRSEARALITRGTNLKNRGITPVAGRIFYAHNLFPDKDEKFEERLKEFCKKGAFSDKNGTWVRHGWKIVPKSKGTPTYFLFDVMEKD